VPAARRKTGFPAFARRLCGDRQGRRDRTQASLIWEGHKAGRHIGYCHIEKLHNLEQLPSTGFTVSCFPVKIERASAGWTRAVAIIDG
jgi:kynurenine formamidase